MDLCSEVSGDSEVYASHLAYLPGTTEDEGASSGSLEYGWVSHWIVIGPGAGSLARTRSSSPHPPSMGYQATAGVPLLKGHPSTSWQTEKVGSTMLGVNEK